MEAERETATPRSVYRFRNGMVVTFDANGRQIPDLQGRYDEVRCAVEEAADESTEFVGWGDEPAVEWRGGDVSKFSTPSPDAPPPEKPDTATPSEPE